jgi:putative aminopeptidase FrvX
MKYALDMAYLMATMEKLINTPSPTGYYVKMKPVIEELAAELGYTVTYDNRNTAYITVPGADTTKTVCISAHADTLGLMVRAINSDGSLNFTKVGSPQMPTLDGEYCTVITRTGKRISGTVLSKSPASRVYDDTASRTRDADNMYIRLDEVVKSADDTRALGIENGDYICIDPKTVVTESGFLKSRFIDDKASVACLLTAMHILHTEGIVPPRDIAILITMYEEVGHGAGYVPEGIVSMLGVDMGCIGRDLACTEYDVSICAKDSGGPYDYPLTSRLIELAKNAGLSYAVDIYPFYGSDVGAMWRAGHDIPGALIGTGVHASHGMERTHYEGIYNTLCLILLYFGV